MHQETSLLSQLPVATNISTSSSSSQSAATTAAVVAAAANALRTNIGNGNLSVTTIRVNSTTVSHPHHLQSQKMSQHHPHSHHQYNHHHHHQVHNNQQMHSSFNTNGIIHHNYNDSEPIDEELSIRVINPINDDNIILGVGNFCPSVEDVINVNTTSNIIDSYSDIQQQQQQPQQTLKMIKTNAATSSSSSSTTSEAGPIPSIAETFLSTKNNIIVHNNNNNNNMNMNNKNINNNNNNNNNSIEIDNNKATIIVHLNGDNVSTQTDAFDDHSLITSSMVDQNVPLLSITSTSTSSSSLSTIITTTPHQLINHNNNNNNNNVYILSNINNDNVNVTNDGSDNRVCDLNNDNFDDDILDSKINTLTSSKRSSSSALPGVTALQQSIARSSLKNTSLSSSGLQITSISIIPPPPTIADQSFSGSSDDSEGLNMNDDEPYEENSDADGGYLDNGSGSVGSNNVHQQHQQQHQQHHQQQQQHHQQGTYMNLLPAGNSNGTLGVINGGGGGGGGTSSSSSTIGLSGLSLNIGGGGGNNNSNGGLNGVSGTSNMNGMGVGVGIGGGGGGGGGGGLNGNGMNGGGQNGNGSGTSVVGGTSGICDQTDLKYYFEEFCPVCGDKVSGYHYGLLTCESCKGFFKRTVQNKKVYTCVADRQCHIDKTQRKRCPFCRFQKCLEVGMKLEAVRADRMRGGRNKFGPMYKRDRARKLQIIRQRQIAIQAIRASDINNQPAQLSPSDYQQPYTNMNIKQEIQIPQISSLTSSSPDSSPSPIAIALGQVTNTNNITSNGNNNNNSSNTTSSSSSSSNNNSTNINTHGNSGSHSNNNNNNSNSGLSGICGGGGGGGGGATTTLTLNANGTTSSSSSSTTGGSANTVLHNTDSKLWFANSTSASPHPISPKTFNYTDTGTNNPTSSNDAAGTIEPISKKQYWKNSKSLNFPRVSPAIRDFVASVDDREWQNQLYTLLQDQSYNQCEVDLFELMCKVLDQNLFSQVDWARNTVFFKDLKVDDQMKLLQNSWSDMLVLDHLHHRLHNNLADETLLHNGQKFDLLGLGLLGVPLLADRFNELQNKLVELKFDVGDYICMKFLLLLNPEYADVRGITNKKTVLEGFENVQAALLDYTLTCYPTVQDKFSKLLGVIPEIHEMAATGEDYLYSKHISGSAPTQTLLMEMLHAKRK